MWSSLAILALLASAQGRAVNISNTWVLPEEGFPVFYRYFRDRISWYEADAVCQFHHANLVTVDTTAQYDAVRAYLKELDISSAVWVGLIRSNPDGDFTWTDYRGLSGDGYWSTAPDTGSAPLCAAADPSADYRWEARACGGPTVASFICELPVPQWALGSEGCMVKELPALTILYLPESAAVQLNADCGLAGVKRVQCTGNVKREGLLKDLSCAGEEDMSSSPMPTSMSTNWPATTDSTGEETTNEATIDEITTTEHTVDVDQPIVITATSLPQYINTKYTNKNKINTVPFNKNVNLGESDDRNIQSNFIPKLVEIENVLTNKQLELEDERHMQHKMLHEEIARVGNVDNIFTQPTDHFIPPLVMAKSRMSDDMTVLSLAEKHAQQIAEKQFGKHSQNDNLDVERQNNRLSLDNVQMDKPLITSVKPNKTKDAKKENLKTHVPKKYVNEKYYETKTKVAKTLEAKSSESVNEATQKPTTVHDLVQTTTVKDSPGKVDDDFGMDLTVILRDATFTSEEQDTYSNKYSGDIDKLETITKKQLLATNQSLEENSTIEQTTATNMKSVDNRTVEHEVIKITVISNTNPAINTTVFEITTKMPIFKDDTIDDSKQATTNPTTFRENKNLEKTNVESTSTPKIYLKETNNKEASTVSAVVTSNIELTNLTTIVVSPLVNVDIGTTAMPLFENKTELTETSTTMKTTAMYNTGDKVMAAVSDNSTNDNISTEKHDSTSTDSYESMEKVDFNNTDIHDQLEKTMNGTEEIDANSPLLSGVYEPVHRPPRTRTPQQQNRKFNPFRILG